MGIDLASTGEHKVRCLDEGSQLCDGFSFQTTPEGLAKLEERIFGDGSKPIIVFEPTGLAWLIVAIYLKARHPDCRLVRVQARKVVALRKYLRRSSKTFGQWFGVLLSAENKRQLWVPEGFAHGFLVLSDVAETIYQATDYYAPQFERCLLWNDPDVGIPWPLAVPPLLSARDAAGTRLADCEVVETP